MDRRGHRGDPQGEQHHLRRADAGRARPRGDHPRRAADEPRARDRPPLGDGARDPPEDRGDRVRAPGRVREAEADRVHQGPDGDPAGDPGEGGRGRARPRPPDRGEGQGRRGLRRPRHGPLRGAQPRARRRSRAALPGRHEPRAREGGLRAAGGLGVGAPARRGRLPDPEGDGEDLGQRHALRRRQGQGPRPAHGGPLREGVRRLHGRAPEGREHRAARARGAPSADRAHPRGEPPRGPRPARPRGRAFRPGADRSRGARGPETIVIPTEKTPVAPPAADEEITTTPQAAPEKVAPPPPPAAPTPKDPPPGP